MCDVFVFTACLKHVNCAHVNNSMQCATDAKHAVLTLVKIKHRTPETRLNPCLIYLSRLEQMHVELTDEHMDEHSGAGGSYVFLRNLV